MSVPFVDTYFENGSSLRCEVLGENRLQIEPVHDYERFTGNRQSQHWNFKLHVPAERLDSTLTIVMPGTDNIWNGRRIQALEGGRLNVAVSSDGTNWQLVEGTPIDARAYGFTYEIKLSAPVIQVARNVPYTPTDLANRLVKIGGHRAVRIEQIGTTVEGRPLEMVLLGNPDGKNQVLIRGAAHPWESGGTWFLDGMMQFLASGEAKADAILKDTCFCLMPMANKDGVARGMSRFTVNGMDLNRNWIKDLHLDPRLVPENACLRRWLTARQAVGKLPRLAIDMHNDCDGRMHLGPHDADPQGYRQRMGRLEQLMRELTWFREGTVDESFRGSMAGGMIEIYGIDAFVYELHSEWAEGLGRAPLHTDWQQLGKSYVEVVRRYFEGGAVV